MRNTLAMLAIVVTGCLVAGPALSQDRGTKKPAASDCDLKTLEKVSWCPKCDKVLEKGDIKDGKHSDKECGTATKEIELCVKKYYAADCHPNKTSEKPGS